MKERGKVETVTRHNFDTVVKNSSFIIIDCWAPWCGPCRMISPILEELANDYSDKVIFGKLNVDENSEVAKRFGIMAIPTILFFTNGNLVDTIVGAVSKVVIEDKIHSLL